MRIAYTLPGSEIVYVVITAPIEIVRRTLCERKTVSRTRDVPETYYEDVTRRVPEYTEKADGTVEVRMHDTVEREHRIRTKQVTEIITEDCELSQEAYEQHIREHLAEIVPPGAANVITLPENWITPSLTDREFWRIRNETVVVEKPGA